jgi:hypothetical protein
MPRDHAVVQAMIGVRRAYRAVLGPARPISTTMSVARQAASAQAFQAVAQSAAFAVQDAASLLRNLTAMSQAAVAVVLVKMVENPVENVPTYSPVLAQVKDVLQIGADNFTAVGQAAGQVMQDFPSS